jgi:hypothetical protein
MHAKRLEALQEISKAALIGNGLSLSRLALGTERPIALKHRIKCVDRLLGNLHLQAERIDLYRALARQWLAGLPQLLIVVDWSPLSPDLRWQWLRASVVVDGRSITVYEEVHPRRQLAAYAVHQQFLRHLAYVLPGTRKPPIIITDAGFRGTWFKLVAGMGWTWVGRVRNRDFVKQDAGGWFAAKQLYAKACAVALDLGLFDAVRSNPLRCRLVLFKRTAQGRKRRYASGKVQDNTPARKMARRQREPWLLSCSPNLSHLSAQAVVAIYAQRMRIEQQFRDSKNVCLGMGLSRSRSTGVARLQALLLIEHIAGMAKRLIGETAMACQLALQFMSTRRRRREISVMTLAERVIASHSLIDLPSPWRALRRLREQVCAAILGPYHAL